VAREAEGLRALGSEVVVIEPTSADLRAMGLNLMDRARSRVVLETARETVGARARRLLDDVALPRTQVPAAAWQHSRAA
jgi:NTE family protein